MAISNKFRIKIKDAFGPSFRYSKEVQNHLINSNKKNTNGKPYSKNHIKQIFNGNRSNLDIEEAIITHFSALLLKQKSLKNSQQELIEWSKRVELIPNTN